MRTQKSSAESKQTTNQAIGLALRDLRIKSGLSARELATLSDVSVAMISRTENGQVSPSISTLEALASALDVPMVSLLRETSHHHSDFTFVKAGEGLKSTRIVNNHRHDYVNLGIHVRRDIIFGARLVTLVKQDAALPIYVGHGVAFIYVISGRAVYQYGKQDIELNPGDSLSMDAELRYGFSHLITPVFEFLAVQVETAAQSASLK